MIIAATGIRRGMTTTPHPGWGDQGRNGHPVGCVCPWCWQQPPRPKIVNRPIIGTWAIIGIVWGALNFGIVLSAMISYTWEHQGSGAGIAALISTAAVFTVAWRMIVAIRREGERKPPRL